MKSFLVYWFWPNPGMVSYGSTKVQLLLGVAALLVVLGLILSVWRRRLKNPVTKSLSKSWPSVSIWFGIAALILTLCRAEGIQYLSMRFLWVVWVAAALLYIWLQFRVFRTKHYEKLPSAQIDDPRSKYLPKKKKR